MLDAPSDPVAISATARFAEFRGVGEQMARARANLPELPWDYLRADTCTAVSGPSDPGESVGGDTSSRELNLLDGGDMRLGLGTTSVVVPLALVPDLVPWVSGVEYSLSDAYRMQWRPEPDGRMPLRINLAGSADDDLSGFSVDAAFPEPLGLSAQPTDTGRVRLQWIPSQVGSDTVTARLRGEGEGAPELACLFSDTGHAEIDLQAFAPNERSSRGEWIVTLSRIEHTSVDAAGFSGIDVLIETQEQQSIRVP
jgi:hypothetical protein